MSDDIIKKIRREGLGWDAVLYFLRVGGTVVLSECDNAGRAIRGTARVAALGTNGDPMWKAQDDDQYRYIGEYTPTHRLHLYRFLLRRAQSISFCVVGAWSGGPFAPMGEHAMDAFDEMSDEMCEMPQTWLVSTPFMMALGALIIGDGRRVELERIHAGLDPDRDWHR